jgi:hypothetical protein
MEEKGQETPFDVAMGLPRPLIERHILESEREIVAT